MSDDQAKRRRGGILGIIGLPPTALLVVAALAVGVWWYYASIGERLNPRETAAVVLGLALIVAICLKSLRALRGVLGRRKSSDKEAPP